MCIRDSIEGIFVSDEMQSCGIGKLLLDYIKDKKVSLRLNGKLSPLIVGMDR